MSNGDENLGVSAGQGLVTVALLNELKLMPDSVRFGSLATLAISLATNIDKGNRIPECSRELRQCLSELRMAANVNAPRSSVDEVARRREERRNGTG